MDKATKKVLRRLQEHLKAQARGQIALSNFEGAVYLHDLEANVLEMINKGVKE